MRSGIRDRQGWSWLIFDWGEMNGYELGYCSGQEVRDGEQWINLSGSWEKWEDAMERGYSLQYLKKIMKKNQGQ